MDMGCIWAVFGVKTYTKPPTTEVVEGFAMLSVWCQGPDLNWRPPHFQCDALPTELPWPALNVQRRPRKLRPRLSILALVGDDGLEPPTPSV